MTHRWHKSATSLAALVLYLASLIAAGLHHHHGQGAYGADPRLAGPIAFESHDPPDCDDDSQTCTICLAVHQPNVATPLAVLAMCGDSVYQPQTARTPQFFPAFQSTTLARAPPHAS